MKIAAFTEGGYNGLVPRNHPNMRTDLAWWCALEAVHHPFQHIPSITDNEYDFGIVIIPKKRRHLMEINLISQLKRVCKKIAVMQESYYNYWQDDPIDEQIWYVNFLMDIDLILCHNDIDLTYYRGLTEKKCELMPTLMIEDEIKPTTQPEDRNGVIIGGNFVWAYGGFDSYVVAKETEEQIFAPVTGRMKEEERGMDINHLDWMYWSEWINNLSRFKYGVQLGTPSAGTFNLNCAYHGIPCIGYNNVNTQKCHPDLSVDVGDIGKAKQLMNNLKVNKDFYNKCSKNARDNYNKYYGEKVFLEYIGEILNETN